MADIRISHTLRDISKEAWDSCYPDEAENYDYLLAVEQAGIAGFSWAYVTLWEEDVLVAAMPAFFSDYALDTTLQGTGKKITTAIAAAFPSLLKVKLACLGSPCTETGAPGFHPDASAAQKAKWLAMLVEEFERFAGAHGCRLIGIKDIPQSLSSLFDKALKPYHYANLSGLPTAYLDIDFSTTDEYLASLSPAARKNMRRKLKAAHAVEIQSVTSLDATLLPEIMALYHDTKSRSDWQFEELTESYFSGVLTHMPERSFCMLYYVHGRLLAANLLVHNGRTLIDKFFCMNHELGREHNLYFLSWLTNIQLCLERGFTRYQSGQEGYESKLRLGSKLTRNQMYFKHRNLLAQGILKLAAPFLAADETMKDAA